MTNLSWMLVEKHASKDFYTVGEKKKKKKKKLYDILQFTKPAGKSPIFK